MPSVLNEWRHRLVDTDEPFRKWLLSHNDETYFVGAAKCNDDCPVAKFLILELSEYVQVDKNIITFFGGNDVEEIQTPEWIKIFIKLADTGREPSQPITVAESLNYLEKYQNAI